MLKYVLYFNKRGQKNGKFTIHRKIIYGFNYGYMPFSEDIEMKLRKLDMGAIELIKNKDIEEFIDYKKKTGITIFGYIPLIVLMSVFENEKVDIELLKYYTSANVLGDYRNSVSYASLVIRQ